MQEPLPQADDNAPPARLRQRVGRRLAALGLVGGLMVALPLVQVLRYQNAELRSLAAARAGLDPVGRAVELQRGLLAHRDMANLVLIGRSSFEPERRVRQGEVDDRANALAVALVSGQWERAVQESDALREDWSLLSRQVQARAVNASESEQAHRLLIEQTLQVMDLVADASTPQQAGGDSLQPTLAAAHTLPRLAWQMALLLGDTPTDIRRWRELAGTEAGIARALGSLDRALERRPSAALALAAANAGAAANGFFGQLRDPAEADLRASLATALRTQFELVQKVHEDALQRLDAQMAATRDQRSALLGLTVALGALALALLASLLRRTQPPPPAPTQAATSAGSATAAPPPDETQRLLQRLREGDERSARQARNETRPTMPGEL
jgi:hypothetical protein